MSLLVSPAYAAAWTGECVSEGVATIQGIQCVLQNLFSPIPALIALAAVGMIIMAGIRIINAGSDPKALASAWQTFNWAVIGLVLLAGVWLILVFIQNFTGANILDFKFQ